MAQYTPMIQQYLAIKQEVPDAFLFFRLGDFYEMFFQDALDASRELEITLTGREGGAEERIPMCGVPYHSAETYIARLVEKGYKVAICEQVEDPAQAKGVVRREIVRIVTPGTVMESKSLPESANNYIASIAGGEGDYGLAACDLSTGEMHVTRFEGSRELLLDELNVYRPSEMLGDRSLLESLKEAQAAAGRPPVLTDWTVRDDVRMLRHFGPSECEGLPETCLQAVSQLLAYLAETQKRALAHIRKLQRYGTDQFMTMDPFTRRNLELVETVRERSRKGSLLWLLDRTVTAMGGRRLKRWIEKPLMSRARIEERLEAVDCLYNQFIVRSELRRQLKGIYDLERLVARIAYGSANARDLAALRSSLAQVPAIRETCAASGSAALAALAGEMDDCAEVRGWIEEAIVDDPPVSIRDGGMIRPGHHDHLDRLRDASISGKQWIAALEKEERERTGIRSLKVGYNKVFGYYIEVTKANVASLPEGRYERKQTLANAERYITPELKEKEQLILEAEEKMTDLEYELFLQLRDRVAGQSPRLQSLADQLAVIDALQSLADVSASRRYCRPEINTDGNLAISGGRHPVVEAVLPDGSFIANETSLGGGDGRMMLITGPNMAGKSTYMRQVAMICLMAQIGCFVPAEKARIPLIDRIFTRIGAADDLIGGQSTFMVEMMDIQVMTARATERSLVIIDELGRGTSTEEGMAIAQAVIEHLHDHVGCKTLVSTHFHELAHLEESLPQLRNFCMAVKESGQQVTFLRKLIPGAASTSYGIYCARIAGLPDSIIRRAYELLNGFEARGEMRKSRTEAAAAVVQLDLFGEREEAEPPKVRTAERKDRYGEAAGRVPAPEPAADRDVLMRVSRRLREADLINMTPLQAMNLLHELKQSLQNQ